VDEVFTKVRYQIDGYQFVNGLSTFIFCVEGLIVDKFACGLLLVTLL